jgi:hypothetical protein
MDALMSKTRDRAKLEARQNTYLPQTSGGSCGLPPQAVRVLRRSAVPHTPLQLARLVIASVVMVNDRSEPGNGFNLVEASRYHGYRVKSNEPVARGLALAAFPNADRSMQIIVEA